ncbi:MAG: hypothetical protein JNK64_13235 [Myxococcales bacterium]|nr:hypothetical protein [Myxococcales bacterium]
MSQTKLDSYIAQKLGREGVRFYHAENLRNFSTYCTAGALLSRAELMRRDPVGFTRFRSDEEDERLGALSRVFGNIYDFGSIFAKAKNTIPNIYGPITLVFRPSVFGGMTDIAITPHSIVTHRDQWQSERVADAATVDSIVGGDGFGGAVARQWQMCELSCAEPALSFGALERILVEPIKIGDKQLVDYVRSVAAGLGVPIAVRVYRHTVNVDLLQNLVSFCEALTEGLDDERWSFDEVALADWKGLTDDKRKRLAGWCRYFYFGTLAEAREGDFIGQMDEADDGDDRSICELCDPGSDSPPALVDYQPAEPGESGRGSLDIGHCGNCNGISVRCRQCDAVHSFGEWEYDKPVSCGGGCGLRFMVVSNRSSDGSSLYVELLDEDAGEGVEG